MRKLFIICLLLLVHAELSAQQDLRIDGDLLAHDVQRTGAMPQAMQALLQGRRLTAETPTPSMRRLRSRASFLRQAQHAPAIQPVAPLLHSIRGQEAPYNYLCPQWTYPGGTLSEEHCLSGCVATSIEQVLAYYRYPEALVDTLHGWTTDNYVLADLLPGTSFDWDNYLLDYRNGWTEAQGMAIALPSLAAGMAVHMNYGLNSSGASAYKAVEPLKRAFGYGLARHYERLLYTPERWHAMLQHELQQGRPIAYTGHNMAMGGHAFNIDGVDDQGFYHINWGYDGYYDGWYDLDRLTPWEPLEYDPMGIVEGFFCNQGALFMHPSEEAKPLEPDSLDIDNLGIVLRSVHYLRPPDTKAYTIADFDFENTGTEEVTYTYEVMTYLPTDEDIFSEADYVGLAGITLAPGESKTQRIYLQFHESGDRLLGISHDDVTIPFSEPVQVAVGTAAKLQWDTLETDIESDENDLFTATFTLSVENQAAAGYAGNLVTYCLYADGHEDEDLRHYTVLNLPAGSAQELSVTFHHLLPDTHYTMLVRCPWPVQTQTDFRTPAATGIQAAAETSETTRQTTRYDLSGRRTTASHGLLIEQGHKRLISKQP